MLRDLGVVADTYQAAYQSYERVLAAGEAHAKAMDELVDAVIGVVIGVGVGLSLGAAFPAAQRAKLAVEAAIELRGELVEAIAGATIKAVASALGPGRAAPSAGLKAFEQAHPAMQRLGAYQEGARLYRELAMLSTRMQGLADINALAGELRADCRELAVSGRHRSLSETQIEARVQLIERDAAAQVTVKDAIGILGTAVEDARIAASLAKDGADIRRMEHDIWIHWMASLSPDEAEILDSDPIEERLGSLGIMAKSGGMMNAPQHDWQSRIHWGVGVWHSDEDSREGARLAARGSKALRMVGQTGTYHQHNEVGRFTDSTGTQWPAVAQVKARSWDLEGATVVVTKASPSGALLWVDLPAAAAEDRRGLYTARQLPGKAVTLTRIVQGVWGSGQLRYSARASSPDFPGRTWPAEMSPRYAFRPTEGAAVVVMHVDSSGTLICRPK